MGSQCLRIWACLVVIPCSLLAQQLPFKIYNIEDGLLQSSVTDILEDRDGYIWFANHAGLSRFDGNEFTNFEIADGLPSSTVRQLILDEEGQLWGGTDDGIFRYDGKGFHSFKPGLGGKPFSVTDLLFDDDGSLLIGYRQGLYRFKEGKFTSLADENPLYLEANTLVKRLKNGDIIFAGDRGMAIRQKGVLKPLLRDRAETVKMIRTIMVDHASRLWIANDVAGLYHYDFETDRFEEEETFREQAVRFLMQDAMGEIWIGTRDNGVYRLKNGQWQNYQIKDGLPSSSIYCIYRDREDSVWFGTYGGGVARLSNENFFNFTRSDGFQDPNVNHISEDREGRWWLGTNAGALSRREGEAFRMLSREQGLINNKVVTILPTSDGRIFYGTLNGLTQLERGKFTSYDNRNGLLNPLVLALEETSGGEVWVGFFVGMARFEQGRFQYAEGSAAYRVHSFAADQENGIWVGTTTGLGYCRDGKFTVPAFAQEWKTLYINQLTLDHAGQIWMATSEGLKVWTGSVLRSWTKADGLANNFCKAVTADRLGRIWVGTNRGVSLFDGKKFVNFTSRDGLAGSEINRGAAYLDSRARIWFGTIAGATIFEENAARQELVPPKIVIKSWSILNTARDLSKTELKAEENRVEIGYTGISFVAADDLEYLCKLEGYDEDWIERREHSVQYTGLPPGRYRFLVKARIGKELLSEQAAELVFVIATPWWQTWWFRVLVLLDGTLLAYGFYTWRVIWLRRRNKELESRVKERTLELERRNAEILQAQKQLVLQERMASLGALTAGVAHEIKNPLNFVNNFSEVVVELAQELAEVVDEIEAAPGPEQLPILRGLSADLSSNADLIQKHGERASDIIAAMSALMGSSGKPQQTNVAQLLNEMVTLVLGGSDSGKTVGLTCVRDYAADLGEVALSARDVGRALVNLLKNSLEALTERRNWGELFEAKIAVRAWREPNFLLISIWDNGVGMPQAVQDKAFTPFFTTKPTGTGHTGLGLSMAYEVVTQHGGRIELNSTPGEFTEVVLILPA